MSGVKIKIHSLGLETTSVEDGFFIFKDVELGPYELDVEVSQQDHYNTPIEHTGQELVINIEDFTLDNIVVWANPLEHNSLKMTTPVAILDQYDLVLNRSSSIDQVLSKIPGVNSASFGLGSGQPVIRGQQGNRVTVLNNNATLQDAGNISPDHWITTEPLLAKQIEVLKGPATLLYGGQAIGGVVNIIDNVIPSQVIEGIEGGVELRYSGSTLSERSAVLTLDAGLSESVMGHFSYFDSSSDSYKIPGYAESDILMAMEEEEHEEETRG